METLNFKVGDKVRVKSLDWYDGEKKDKYGDIIKGCRFTKGMAVYCKCLLTIKKVYRDFYLVNENNKSWQDWMLDDESVTEEKQEVEQLNKKVMETKEMTKQEVLDFLKNKKIRCDSEQESIDVQNKLFDLGINWLAGVKELEKYYLFFINEKNQLTYGEGYNYWIEDVREELKVQDILSIQIKEEKPKFDPNTLQPFDKVLVRKEGKQWLARFFDIYKGGYNVTSGHSWTYCIPYNEETKHLHGTCDEAPEFYQVWK